MTRRILALPGTVAAALCLAAPATSQTTLYDVRGTSDGNGFGFAMARADDVDGDGIADLAVTAPTEILSSGPSSGQFGLIQMRSGGDGSLIWSVDNPLPTGTFGNALTTVNDLDGDGLTDLVASVLDLSTPSLVRAEGILVISSASGATLASIRPLPSSEFTGTHMERVGDVDGDGVDDLALRGRRTTPGGFEPVVFFVSSATLQHVGQITGPASAPSFGASVCTLPDLNGDGTEEIVIGAFTDDTAGVEAGAVRFYSGLASSPWRTIQGAPGAFLGRQLLPLPDVDADGAADLAISATPVHSAGSVQIVSGASGQTLVTHDGTSTTSLFGVSLALVGDVDGDGRVDIAIGEPLFPVAGSPGAGSVRVATAVTGDQIQVFLGDAEHQALGWDLVALEDTDGDGYPGIAMAGVGITPTGLDRGRLFAVEGPMGPDCTAPVFGCAQPTVNSVGGTGTVITFGTASLSNSSLRIVARDLPPGTPVLLLASPNAGIVSTPPGSQGNLCLNAPIGRSPNLGTASLGGNVVFSIDLDAIPTPGGPVVATPSDVLNFQMWYRDGGPMPTSRWTEMVTIDVCP
ncbi:MAG: VCBS repeat-containing protein [Planctomycetota bacterium]